MILSYHAATILQLGFIHLSVVYRDWWKGYDLGYHDAKVDDHGECNTGNCPHCYDPEPEE